MSGNTVYQNNPYMDPTRIQYALCSLKCESESGKPARATVKLSVSTADAAVVQIAEAESNGMIDAAVKAVNKILPHALGATFFRFSIHNNYPGSETGLVYVEVHYNGLTYEAWGHSENIVEATVIAYVQAMQAAAEYR